MPRYENIHTYIISTTYIWYEWNIHYNQISFSAGKKYLEWNTHQRRSRPGLQFTTNWKTCFQLMPVLNLTIFYHYWNKIVDILQTQFPNYKMFHSFYKVWILVYYNQVPLTLGLFSLSLSCSPDSSEKKVYAKKFSPEKCFKVYDTKIHILFCFSFYCKHFTYECPGLCQQALTRAFSWEKIFKVCGISYSKNLTKFEAFCWNISLSTNPLFLKSSLLPSFFYPLNYTLVLLKMFQKWLIRIHGILHVLPE